MCSSFRASVNVGSKCMEMTIKLWSLEGLDNNVIESFFANLVLVQEPYELPHTLAFSRSRCSHGFIYSSQFSIAGM